LSGAARGRRDTRNTKKGAEGRGVRKGKDALDGKGKTVVEEQPGKRVAKAARREWLVYRM
jgi:hypothetical protein